MSLRSEKVGRDTSPLLAEELSREERSIIEQIEQLLEQARDYPLPEVSDALQPVLNRNPQVLLLDGGRGTGKTSLLLTMIDQWNRPHPSDAKQHFVVLKLIDFDPLPPGIPLVAGVIQSWKILAERCHELADDDDDGDLMDQWHNLFQIAVAGWTNVPNGRGLVQQVLDREEQIQDWNRLSDMWRSFVNNVILHRRSGATQPPIIPDKPVFVIMIDDVDLQVARIRELLPALRMLYHPRVFFIVAAHRPHMVSMLELDYRGQQRRLGESRRFKEATQRNWPGVLANAACQKVFPRSNIWQLQLLSLQDFLEFPLNRPECLKTFLDFWKSKVGVPLGEYLSFEGGLDFRPLMSYRTVSQLADVVSTETGRNRALQTMEELLRGFETESENSVQLLRGDESDPESGELEYLKSGEVVALFEKGLSTEVGNRWEVVLSARPDFRYQTTEGDVDYPGAEGPWQLWPQILAISLRDDDFGLVASRLQWNVTLALAWTSIELTEGNDRDLEFSFWWRFRELPSPIGLIKQARIWEKSFLRPLSKNPLHQQVELAIERIAYAWVYYQLLIDPSAQVSQRAVTPLHEDWEFDKAWDSLLAIEPRDTERWFTQVLPLMARPELGMSSALQTKLLARVQKPAQIQWLREQRRNLITDAILAAAQQKNKDPIENPENTKTQDRLAAILEERYKRVRGEPSPWSQTIERKGSRPTRVQGARVQ